MKNSHTKLIGKRERIKLFTAWVRWENNILKRILKSFNVN
jgi:hypothetical protein